MQRRNRSTLGLHKSNASRSRGHFNCLRSTSNALSLIGNKNHQAKVSMLRQVTKIVNLQRRCNMKGLLSAFVLVIVTSVSAAAQDSTMPSQSGSAQNSTMAQQGDGSMAQPGSTAAVPASAQKGHGS